jgi:hypothetical protein
MIFAISTNTKAPGFDSRKTESDSLAQCGCINMRNSVLIAHPAVGKVQALSRYVPIRVRRIICCQPLRSKR